MFVKKIIMPNSVENLGHIKCYNLISPDQLKVLAIVSDNPVRRFSVDLEDLKPY